MPTLSREVLTQLMNDLQRLIEALRLAGAPSVIIFAHGSALLLLDAQRSQTIQDVNELLDWIERHERKESGQ